MTDLELRRQTRSSYNYRYAIKEDSSLKFRLKHWSKVIMLCASQSHCIHLTSGCITSSMVMLSMQLDSEEQIANRRIHNTRQTTVSQLLHQFSRVGCGCLFYVYRALCHRNVTSGPSLPNRFSGLLITKPSWPPAALTGGSTCGTSARSERNSHQRMPRMALLSCWSVATNAVVVDLCVT